jgi:hypothetical protein
MYVSTAGLLTRLVLLALLGMFSLCSCSPTYAPPIRTTHFGMPGHLQGGKVEIGGGMNINEYSGGPVLAVALTDWLQLEAGADINDGSHAWNMYFGGIRASVGYVEDGVGGAVDLELGGGAGVGGEYEGNEDTMGWKDRSASGWYVGCGAGFQIDWFSAFVRGRFQASWATGIPETTWWTLVGGIQATIADSVNLYIAGGGAGYTNSMDQESGLIGEFGLSVELPVFYKPPPKKMKREPEPTDVPVFREKKTKPWPPPVPVEKKPIADAVTGEPPAEVQEEPEAAPEVKAAFIPKPCPTGAQVMGQPPPDGFEMFCAVRDPKVRYKHQGWYIGWYENGQKASQGEYVDGQRHGTWIFWHSNGQKRLEAGYHLDEKRGRWTFWDKNGAETKVIDYQD